LDEHIDQIYELATNYKDSFKVSVVWFPLEEIMGNDYNLNIPRYVEPVIEEDTITLDKALTNLQQSYEEAYQAEKHLKGLLIKEGLLNG